MSALSLKERIAAKRGDIAAGRAKGLRPYKFKVGITKFRILPKADPAAEWDRKFGQLYLKSFDGQDFVVIGDRHTTYGEEDPIREMVFGGMKAAQSDDIKNHFKEMLGGTRELFNALILNDPDQPAGEPVLVEVSEGAFDDILAQFEIYLDMDPDYDLASLNRGHIFQCERVGTGKNDTKYTFLATPQPAPLKPAILEKLIDMDAWIDNLFLEKEQKALAVLAKLGVNVGGAGSVSSVLSAPSAGALAAPVNAAPDNVSSAAVTSVLEDPAPVTPAATVEDAIFAEVTEEVLTPAAVVTPPVAETVAFDPTADAEAEAVAAFLAERAAKQAAAAAATPAASPVASPVAAAVTTTTVEATPVAAPVTAAEPAALSSNSDIDAILASLD